MKGKLITIEGIDGVGKTTHTKKLVEYLRQKGLPVVLTNEPGGTQIADKIRALIRDKSNQGMTKKTELFLFLASRAEHYETLILPALQQGKIVVCDRFVDSTICYQGYGLGLDIQVLDYLNRYIMDDINIDLTIWLDLDSESGFVRKGGKSLTDRMESYENDFYKKVYSGFRDLCAKYPRICRIDSSGTVEQTFKKIEQCVQNIVIDKL